MFRSGGGGDGGLGSVQPRAARRTTHDNHHPPPSAASTRPTVDANLLLRRFHASSRCQKGQPFVFIFVFIFFFKEVDAAEWAAVCFQQLRFT